MSDTKDEHSGKGGSYVVRAGGKRELQERSGHVVPPVQPAAPAAAKSTKSPKGKGVNNA